MFISVSQLIDKLYLASRDMQANDPEARHPKSFIIPCFSPESRMVMEEAFLNYLQDKYGITQTHTNLDISNERISRFCFSETGIEIILLDV